MTTFRLSDMTRGWVVGDFEPSVHRTTDCEMAVQEYPAGHTESRHHHKLADEITIVVQGKARINSLILEKGEGVKIPKGTSAEFEALEDTTTVVFKTISAPSDKYLDSPHD